MGGGLVGSTWSTLYATISCRLEWDTSLRFGCELGVEKASKYLYGEASDDLPGL